MSDVIDMVGRVFGRLTVISRATNNKYARATWLCRCSCGNINVVNGGYLRSGDTKSCGCLTHEGHAGYSKTHGMSGTPTFRSWEAMLERCNSKTCRAYKYYGGRGIKVCVRWLSFANFLSDMGVRPNGTTLDRIDNDGNYEPGNCRWATPSQQSNNTRCNRRVIAFGESKTVTEWSRDPRCIVQVVTLIKRLNADWDVERAITATTNKGWRKGRMGGWK